MVFWIDYFCCKKIVFGMFPVLFWSFTSVRQKKSLWWWRNVSVQSYTGSSLQQEDKWAPDVTNIFLLTPSFKITASELKQCFSWFSCEVSQLFLLQTHITNIHHHIMNQRSVKAGWFSKHRAPSSPSLHYYLQLHHIQTDRLVCTGLNCLVLVLTWKNIRNTSVCKLNT